MIDKIVKSLSLRPTNNIVNNFYFKNEKETQSRLNNIAEYLEYYINNPPKYILVGEAPGYKGCAQSGIPFTSQYIISNTKFFKSNFQLIGGEEKERTSTVIWKCLETMKQYPLLWNAFPFHPHEENVPNTNRPLLPEEEEEGLQYIQLLQIMFPKSDFVAVGGVAEKSLIKLGISVYDKACHPAARNGIARFKEQMTKILAT